VSRLYLADTSVLVLAQRDSGVAARLDQLLANRSLATCVTVDLEVGYSARTPGEHAAIIRDRELLFVDLPVTPAVCERARDIQSRMATKSQHRAAGAFDVLTAAVADVHGAVILHNDADFEHISSITGQPVERIAPSTGT